MAKTQNIGDCLMVNTNMKVRALVALTALLFLLTGMSSALADQVTVSYVDADGAAQTITLDCNTSTADLALAASLVGENGVSMVNDADAGCGSLPEIAAAMAAAAPVFAASIAQAFAAMSPGDTDAIVAAVNAVSGVNGTAVLAAVHFGPAGVPVGPQSIGSESQISVDLMQIEAKPSDN
jgi:hypothetical protein